MARKDNTKKKKFPVFGLILLLAVLCGGGYVAYKHFYGDDDSARKVVKGSTGKVFVEERSFYDHRGNKIYGKIYHPQDTLGAKPLLLYCHGLGQTGDEGVNICTEAAKRGIVAYALDFKGGGPSSRSAGGMLDMSPTTEVRDVQDVLKRLVKEESIDEKRIFLCGHSLGAYVASLEGCTEPRKIRGMVLLAPAYNMPEVASLYFPDRNRIPEKTDFLGFTVGRGFFWDIHGTDPYRKAGKFGGPVLIIHGDADDVVPISFSQKASQAFRDCTFLTYEGVGHSFAGDIGKRMRADVMAWLEEQISK